MIRCSSMNLYGELSLRMPAVSIWTTPAVPLLEPRFREGTLKQLTLHGGTPRIGMYLGVFVLFVQNLALCSENS
ncbi:hypothetical protein [Paraburkholderia sp. MM5477-R1]|uniref:hypothetical protein n=1 Tax=Paraburkholderia sp. MM5477-R1 TaxID=2991062 RepID=UPI003D1E450F